MTLKDKTLDWIKSILIALALALFIRAFFIQAYKIPSGSMIPTLLVGDYLLVNKITYGIKNPFNDDFIYLRRMPERQEIVVFTYPVDHKVDFIKRAIGLPGDTVKIVNKRVYVNGKALKEPYVQLSESDVYSADVSPRDNFGPVTVPEGHIFVLGDNRDHSYDSRFWGFVPIKYIKGRALVIYFSWDGENKRIRLNRLGRLIK